MIRMFYIQKDLGRIKIDKLYFRVNLMDIQKVYKFIKIKTKKWKNDCMLCIFGKMLTKK